MSFIWNSWWVFVFLSNSILWNFGNRVHVYEYCRLIDNFITSSNLIHPVVGYKSLDHFSDHLPIKLKVTSHLCVSTAPCTVENNPNTFVRKPKWLTAIVWDINLYKQSVNYVFIGVRVTIEHCKLQRFRLWRSLNLQIRQVIMIW